MRGLQGKCRTAHKQKIPNALFRLNQFLKIRKKNEEKEKDSATLTKKTENVTINNIIQESQKENVQHQADLNQTENVPVETTTTNVVFLDLSSQTNETNTVEEEREDTIIITRWQKGQEDKDDRATATREDGDRNTPITITRHRQKGVKQDTTVMTDQQEGVESEGSGSEIVTELVSTVDSDADSVTDQPEEESSTVADSFYEENSLEYQITRSEQFLNVDNEIMENVPEMESSGDMENLEVNVPFP